MKLEQLKNKKAYVLSVNNYLVLFSYESPVLAFNRDTQSVILGEDHAYSTTTSKHINEFLKEYGLLRWLEELNSRTKRQKEVARGNIECLNQADFEHMYMNPGI